MAEKSISVLITEAIDSGDSEAIQNLFAENPEQKTAFTYFGGTTWLGYAAQVGNMRSIQALIEVGVDVNLGDKRENVRPICDSASKGHYEVVEYLLEKGAELDVSTSLRNPLFAAIVGRSPSIVSLLLEAGIDSRVRYNSKTMKKMDAVAFALLQGEKECARIIALWNANGDDAVAQRALEEADQIAEENAR